MVLSKCPFLIWNADHLLAMSLEQNNYVVWIGESKNRFDSTKFKLSCSKKILDGNEKDLPQLKSDI